jgi:hypothetical protein
MTRALLLTLVLLAPTPTIAKEKKLNLTVPDQAKEKSLMEPPPSAVAASSKLKGSCTDSSGHKYQHDESGYGQCVKQEGPLPGSPSRNDSKSSNETSFGISTD